MAVEKQRIIQESVPGKQVTLCHVIASPDAQMSQKLGLKEREAVGIMTISPYEASLIAADSALKAADVTLSVVDRFTGSLIVTGAVCAVEASLISARGLLADLLGFDAVELTRS